MDDMSRPWPSAGNKNTAEQKINIKNEIKIYSIFVVNHIFC